MRTCTICKNPAAAEINVALLAGEAYRRVAQQYAASPDAVYRHSKHLLPETTRLAVAQAAAVAHVAQDVAGGMSLLTSVRALQVDAQRIAKDAEAKGDLRTALAGVRELARICELLAKLQGDIDAPVTNVNIMNVSPEQLAATREAMISKLAGR